MKKFKSFISLMLVTTVLSTQIAFADVNQKTLQFTDLQSGYWAYESIGKINASGFINGYPDGTFRPEGNITRAELVKIANQIFSYTQKQQSTVLKDVLPSEWYYNEVLVAQNAGYIIGYTDGTFKPNNFVTRQELCKILDAINKFENLQNENDIKPTDEVSPWAVDYVNKVISNKIMTLDINNKFRATEYVTRAEACDALAKFVKELPVIEVPSIPSTGGSTGTIGGSTGEEISQEVYDTMEDVISDLKKLNLSGNEKTIINTVIDSMEQYMDDSNYDYKSAANSAISSLSTEEKINLMNAVISSPELVNNIEVLKDVFFPE